MWYKPEDGHFKGVSLESIFDKPFFIKMYSSQLFTICTESNSGKTENSPLEASRSHF